MTAIRAAFALAVLALNASAARADQITLANSPSVQARWEGEWQKTHPMNNQANPPPRSPSRCTVSTSPGGARTVSCQ